MPLTEAQLNATKAGTGGFIGPTGQTIAAVDLTDGATLALPKHALIYGLLAAAYLFWGQETPAGYSDKGEAKSPRGPWTANLVDGVWLAGRLYQVSDSFAIGITTGMTAGTYRGFILTAKTVAANGVETLVGRYWIPYVELENFSLASIKAIAIT